MKKTSLVFAGLTVLAFGVAACSKPAQAPASAPAAESMPAADSSNMTTPMTPPSAGTNDPVKGEGVVTAVDAAAGTVTLDHDAINAINWPAMKMQFKAEDPMILNGIAAGDHVVFELKSTTETGTITMVKKQ